MADTFEEFTDPRLAALYDYWSDSRDDVEFYLALAEELAPASILDVGCGTGVITCELAERGYRMIGLDPAGPMLEIARSRRGAEAVRWIEGDARRLAALEGLEGMPVDLAIMTAHVPQVIHDQDAWRLTLHETHRAVRPGGYLAFESRNPGARGWEEWTPERSRRRVQGTPFGAVEIWCDLTDVEGVDAVEGGVVRYDIHYVLLERDDEVVSHNALRFRSMAAYEQGLRDAGFEVERVYGDWDRSALTSTSPELIIIARRT